MDISINLFEFLITWKYSMSEPTFTDLICEILLFILDHVVERA